jgi:SOS response regulatory protein OraA/RecX
MAALIENFTTTTDDPGLVVWRVAGKRMGPLRHEDARALGVREGAAWTPKLARDFERLKQRHACRAAALSMLARRDHPAALLLQKLRRRWPESVARETVAQMQNAGWVNDAAYADRRAESMTRRGAASAELLESRLADEGVPDAIAARAARSAATTPQELARRAKRLLREGSSPARIARSLARAGFDADTIQTAMMKAGIEWDPDA